MVRYHKKNKDKKTIFLKIKIAINICLTIQSNYVGMKMTRKNQLT